MRRFLVPGLLACYGLFLVGILAITWQEHTAKGARSFVLADGGYRAAGDEEQSEPPPDNPAPYDGADTAYNPYDPPLRRLLHCSSRYDRNHTTRFFNALSALFQKNDKPLTDYEPGWFIDEGYAVPVEDGSNRYVVAILRGWGHVLPGDDTQYLFLLDADGKILDRVSCTVEASRTRAVADHPATFRTDLAHKPESDGARLIVRFLPPKGESLSGSWSHQIVASGLLRDVRWDVEKPGDVSWAEFKAKGLCRVTIRDGKLIVLFPDFNKG